jgi:dTMP kinase
MSQTGKFIVIDGGEGSGKGTVLDALKGTFPQGFVFTREPGGTPLAEKIREVIFSEEAKETDALTNFALFWAARADHMLHNVRPSLEQGLHVISDRFDLSTFAYQLYGQENHNLLELFWQMRRMYSVPVPDLYIYLDVDPEIGLARVRGRGTGNHYDERDIEFHQRVREGYQEFLFRSHDQLQGLGSRCKKVDASKCPHDVIYEVLSIVSEVTSMVPKLRFSKIL